MHKVLRFNNLFDKTDYIQPDGCPDVSVLCEDLQTEISNQNSEYLGDLITEIADSNVSIYYSDLVNECSTRAFNQFIQNSINEYGLPQSQDNFIEKLYQQGEFYYYSEYLYKHVNEIASNALIDYITTQSIHIECDDAELIDNTRENLVNFVSDYVDELDVDYNDYANAIINDFNDEINNLIDDLTSRHSELSIRFQDNSENEKIKALLIPVGQVPRVIELDAEKPMLKQLQEIVGGYIDHLPVYTPNLNEDVDIVLNDEGKLLNLPLNRYLKEYMFSGNKEDTQIFDYLAGDCVMLSANDEGDYVSISDEAIKYWSDIFKTPQLSLGQLLLDDEQGFNVGDGISNPSSTITVEIAR